MRLPLLDAGGAEIGKIQDIVVVPGRTGRPPRVVGFVASSQLDVSWAQYTQTALEALQEKGALVPVPMDVYAGLLKSIVFGGIIAVISCASGLEARGGALGVGRATSQAVRDSIIALIISNYFMTWFLYR